MKRIYLYAIIFLIGILPLQIVVAQTVRSAYFMETSYMRTSMNPALRPDQGYIGIPLLSNIYLGARTNTFNLDNLTFPMNGERVTFMHAGIPSDQALKNISDNNYISSESGLSIYSMGFFKNDAFWNVDIRLRATTDTRIPRSVFELLKNGFNENETVTHNLSNINQSEKTFTELGVAHSRPFLNNSLIVGARAKMIIGLSNISLNANSMYLTAGSEYWKARSQVTLQASGPGISTKYVPDDSGTAVKNRFDGFDYQGFSIPGYGLGLDIGGEYNFKNIDIELLKGLKVSYALNDIGFIYWTKNNAVHLASPDSEVTITPNDYSLHFDGNTTINDLFSDAISDVRNAIDLNEVPSSGGYSTSLRLNMNAGLEYEVWKNKMTAGLLYSTRFGEYFNTSEFTVSANYKPNAWFATTLSYSFVYSAFNTLGLAVNLAPSKWVNFFIASDYVTPHVSSEWIPTTSKALNLQLGISIPMGGKR